MKRITIVLAFALFQLFALSAKAQTIRQQMGNLESEHGVSFVYDSSLPLDAPYQGEPLQGLP